MEVNDIQSFFQISKVPNGKALLEFNDTVFSPYSNTSINDDNPFNGLEITFNSLKYKRILYIKLYGRKDYASSAVHAGRVRFISFNTRNKKHMENLETIRTLLLECGYIEKA